MPSPPPLQYGQYYHIYNRGNNRGDIFFEKRNYRHFLKLYARYIVPIADTYAYCLLQNHFHFLVRIKTPEEQEKTRRVSETQRVSDTFTPGKPSQQFGTLFNAYAKAINKAYQRTGSLFENPFGRVPVTSESHLVYLVTYIHQNPQKHGFVKDFRRWPYASYHACLSQEPTRLERDEVLSWFHGPAAFQDSHRRMVREAQIAPLVPDDSDWTVRVLETLRVSPQPPRDLTLSYFCAIIYLYQDKSLVWYCPSPDPRARATRPPGSLQRTAVGARPSAGKGFASNGGTHHFAWSVERRW